MKNFGNLFILTLAFAAVSGQECGPEKHQCLMDIESALEAGSDDLSTLCPYTRPGGLATVEECLGESCFQLLDELRNTLLNFEGQCEPGCEEFQRRSRETGQCLSQLQQLQAGKVDENCNILQNIASCVIDKIQGCPLLNTQYYGVTKNEIQLKIESPCVINYGDEKLTAPPSSECLEVSLEQVACKPQDTDLADIWFVKELTNRTLCRAAQNSDISSYKNCLVEIEDANPECFTDDLTDDGSSGRIKKSSVFLDLIENYCSEDCDNHEKAEIEALKCLPQASADIKTSLISVMEGSNIEGDCQAIEDWIDEGIECAQALVGNCKATAYTFNALGVEQFVYATQDSDTGDLYKEAQSACNIPEKKVMVTATTTTQMATTTTAGVLGQQQTVNSSVVVLVGILGICLWNN